MRKLRLLVVLSLLLSSFAFAAETGVITGVILDGKSGDPLIDAGVEVVETGKKAFTDIDGKYSLELTPGKYEIRVFYPQYQGQRVKDIVVSAGKPTRIDLSLEPRAAEVEVVEVVVDAVKATEAAQLLIRKKAPAVMDSVSAEAIAKQPDADVAAVVERLPGITVVDDKFVYIRGLGDRYTSASLNENSLPSTRVEKKVVPLDLFSSDVVESINVVKSYTPDLPGEFSGGIVQINTKDFPEVFELKLSASVGYNSKTTGKDFKTYHGGDWDWLAFDDGTRDLPDSISDDQRVSPKGIVAPGYTPEELEKIGEDFSNVWNPTTKTAPPSFGGNFHIGNRFGKFGIVFDLTYDADFQTTKEDFATYTDVQQAPAADYDITYWEETYNWSSILNMGYEISPDHKISFKNFYTRKAQDQVRFFEGKNDDFPGTGIIQDTRLFWSEESIYLGQLLGDHNLGALKSNIHWQFGYGHSTLDEPDMREAIYIFDESLNEFVYHPFDPSGTRLYSELDEDSWEGGFDWEIDFREWFEHPLKVKFGPALSYRDRTFDHRRFFFHYVGSPADIDFTQDPESILGPENIRPDGFVIQENTRPTDHYDADHLIAGGYLMADTPYFFFEKLRFVGGLRVEYSDQTMESFDPFSVTALQITTENKETDFFPSLNLIYSLKKDMNLRFSFSQTVNRPEFREIAPFLFTDIQGGYSTEGNPELKRALIRSYDARWEWFLSPEELLALSFFYKDMEDPIERIKQKTATQSRSTFQNSLGADNYGFEVEVRKNLGFIHPVLSPFSIFANYTYVDSSIELDPEETAIMTSKERPLQGQSDHVANVFLEYRPRKWDLTARLLYNYVGERISDVGIIGNPDIIEEPTEWLDFILIKTFGNLGIKLSVKNLLDEDVLFTQAGKTVQRYSEGISASLSVSYGF